MYCSRTDISPADARKLEEKIKKKGGAGLVGIKTNLVDEIWGDKRPLRPQEKIRVLPLRFAGKPFTEKIEDLRKELEKKKSAGLIICKPWILANLPSIHSLKLSIKQCLMKLLGFITFGEMSKQAVP